MIFEMAANMEQLSWVARFSLLSLFLSLTGFRVILFFGARLHNTKRQDSYTRQWLSIIYIISSRFHNKLISFFVKWHQQPQVPSASPPKPAKTTTSTLATRYRAHSNSSLMRSRKKFLFCFSLKRNNVSRSLTRAHTLISLCLSDGLLIKFHAWKRSSQTHLIVSGSISFRWFDDAWKMLLLLMFILFSLLHNRIVDIFFRANFTTSFTCSWLWLSFFSRFNWKTFFCAHTRIDSSRLCVFISPRHCDLFTKFHSDSTRFSRNFSTDRPQTCFHDQD